jgi:hypothetical protein
MATNVPPTLVVPSNWSVALNVPVSWITAAAEEGVTLTVRQAPAVVQAPESEAVRLAVAGMVCARMGVSESTISSRSMDSFFIVALLCKRFPAEFLAPPGTML